MTHVRPKGAEAAEEWAAVGHVADILSRAFLSDLDYPDFADAARYCNKAVADYDRARRDEDALRQRLTAAQLQLDACEERLRSFATRASRLAEHLSDISGDLDIDGRVRAWAATAAATLQQEIAETARLGKEDSNG